MTPVKYPDEKVILLNKDYCEEWLELEKQKMNRLYFFAWAFLIILSVFLTFAVPALNEGLLALGVMITGLGLLLMAWILIIWSMGKKDKIKKVTKDLASLSETETITVIFMVMGKVTNPSVSHLNLKGYWRRGGYVIKLEE